jgi:hypothetical protein
MRYAFQESLTTIVGAADTLVEFEDFVMATDTTRFPAETLGIVSAEQASLMDMLTEDKFQGFKKAPVVVEHPTPTARDAFIEKFGIIIVKRNAVVGKQEDMLLEAVPDPYSAQATDLRPIEEVHGLDVDDRWDKRSDEQKAKDEEDKKEFNKAQKKGDISGDSFGPNPNRKKPKKTTDEHGNPLATVTDIKAVRDDDGNIEIDTVLAVKGLYEPREGEGDTYEDRMKVPHDPNKPGATLANSIANASNPLLDELRGAFEDLSKEPDADADDENLEVDTKGVIAIYHKVEVTGSKLAEVRALLLTNEIDLNHTAIVQRNNAVGCWFTFIRQMQAEETVAFLVAAGMTVETYAVNDAGERLVPKGVQVVDADREGEEHPRVWNFRAKEIRKMKKAEKDANRKTIKPGEFIFCGNYEGAVHGTIIYVTPKSYFKEHGKMWDQPLDIQHLLPMDFKEIGPGLYRSNARDWNHISFDMNSRGFKENLMLQIALNAM